MKLCGPEALVSVTFITTAPGGGGGLVAGTPPCPATCTLRVAPGPIVPQPGVQLPCGPNGGPRVSRMRDGVRGTKRPPLLAAAELGEYEPLTSKITSTDPWLL